MVATTPHRFECGGPARDRQRTGLHGTGHPRRMRRIKLQLSAVWFQVKPGEGVGPLGLTPWGHQVGAIDPKGSDTIQGRRDTMPRLVATLSVLLLLALAPAEAQDLITKKQTFELASFTTQSGRTLKNVKVGWESYGTLNADKSNAILICHFFSGNSHAAGKYAEAEKVAGYWDSIIGPGKAIDTNKYFVLSFHTLVNLTVSAPTVTTGPASIDPDTGKPYGLTFPAVSIRDFIEVQKKLVDSLGIKKLI